MPSLSNHFSIYLVNIAWLNRAINHGQMLHTIRHTTNRILAAGLLLVSAAGTNAQQIAQGAYWIYFTDKENNGYEVAEPEKFLSPRSIDRRAWQGLSVDETDEPVTPSYLEAIRAMGIQVRHVSRWLNGAALFNINDSVFHEVLQLPFTDTLSWEPLGGVKYFPPYPSGSRFTPPLESPPVYDYGISAEQVTQLDMDFVHRQGYTGKGVWVGLLDAGYRNVDSLPAFESMIADERLLGTRNFVSDSSVFRLRNNHGMFVLSIAGAEWDGYLVGTAPHASYFLCATEDVFRETKIEEIAWIEAAEYLDSLGIDVLNTSLGYSDFNGSEFDYTYADMDGTSSYISRAASMCVSKGIIASVSAGNEGNSSWYRITAPSDASEILAVGAVDSTGLIASFSSRGPSYDGRVKPDVVAMGRSTGIQYVTGLPARGNGTSFSAPLITGATASLWQASPEVPAKELITRIKQSADRYINPDATYGYGIPSYKQAYWLVSGNTPAPPGREMGIYPNPAGDRVMISLSGNRHRMCAVSVYDINGKLAHADRVNLPGYLLLPENLPAGIYILAVETPSGILRERFIKE